MANRTDRPPEQPTPPHRTPSRVANEPATVEACAQDRAGHTVACEGAARDQLAFTRINAAGGHS
ncbi:hypothetical protein ACWIID_09170 [Streptomyces phaeochromogenes]